MGGRWRSPNFAREKLCCFPEDSEIAGRRQRLFRIQTMLRDWEGAEVSFDATPRGKKCRVLATKIYPARSYGHSTLSPSLHPIARHGLAYKSCYRGPTDAGKLLDPERFRRR
ncbi:homogentisate 1,2-dioxygenase [Pseudozyma hubeiensis SY62]|uniref:Homogentisate 1,2-dioxygenase n=1 Tax=Pseudozyma hubeiensis (strain SY62) TaxID=1305764 RepID=R9PCQ5_PSEHS|nr:homogentisate 1,2-dioxygenase [Pseudozyma hubeiensis SY62]GAC99183.1 homogentisate 1,2-dioxygenase [Pseudozyma hubeiensis SY62]